MNERVPDAAELADDIREIRESLSRLVDRLLPRELFEATHSALRSEVARELARIHQELERKASREALEAVNKRSESAHRMSWGVAMMLAAVIVTALVGFLATGAPS